eukprot:TRINITY_DN41_c0_g1_i1.p1 TRINITY_DN41_c0_g1~~TRINITY_DN41_c0_g1_i1.p1  ORF type:complete len:210 (+),score=42.57 TRINITY_DN41_c0_g1_i1:1040-1669(+)
MMYPIVSQVAQQFKGQLLVAQKFGPSPAISWGASGALPTAILVPARKGSDYVIWNEDTEGPLTTESLTNFVTAARAGTYSSYIKSEPLPEDNDGPVTVVVGKTLNDYIHNEKDVFIEFYAPWCGHCKNLAPIWEELGASYKDDDDIVIAKIDATANKVPNALGVTGFPTLIFFNSNGRQSLYNGKRTLDDMKQFVESRRTSKPSAQAEL